MTADIVTLPTSRAERTPLGHAIRTGESSYKQLENLHAEGRLSASTVIVDASKARFQKDFIASVQESGGEVILDTKCAELSEIGRCNGYARGAPWALNDEQRPLVPTDYRPGANIDLFNSIARFAVELGVDAVFAPTHYIRAGVDDNWWFVDRKSLTFLREALDKNNGSHIGIDYPLIAPHKLLNDEEQRRRLVSDLIGLPFDNLVVRLSGFGSAAGPLMMKHAFRALNDLQMIGKPIVFDHIGGLIGMGALAFGYVSGIAHGIGERERFDARDWDQPPKKRAPDAPAGRATYIPVPGFDRAFLIRHIELISATPKDRRLVSCDDRNCCPNGLKSMLHDLKGHIAYQKFKSVNNIAAAPNSRRAQHFLDSELQNAERKARDLAQLSTGDPKVDHKLSEGRKRVSSLIRTFETLLETMPDETPPPVVHRLKNLNGRALRLV